MPTPHTEHVADWRTPHVEIDRDRRLVRNIALTALNSKNGYRYTESALRDALPLYDRKPVFLDHPPAPSRPHDRSTRDLVGAVINPRYEDGRIRADVELLDTDAGRTFLALAEAEHPAVGMSHVVLADRSPDNTAVERIHDVVSIDAVVFPATTRTLRESAARGEAEGETERPRDGATESPSERATERLRDGETNRTAHESAPALSHSITPPPHHSAAPSLHPSIAPSLHHSISPSLPPWSGPVEPLLLRLDALLPDHVARLAAVPASRVRRAGLFSHTLLVEVTDPAAPPRYFALAWQTEGDALRLDDSLTPVSIDTLHAACGEARNQHIDQLLTRAGLPPTLVTPHFRQQLREAPNDTAREALLQDRRLILEQLRTAPPTSHPRLNPATNNLSDQSIIAAIRSNGRRP